MNLMLNIPLSAEEKQKLVELSQTGPELLIHRARLILAYAEGKPTLQASREAGISPGRARFWKRQFFAKRMDIFHQGITDGNAGGEPALLAGMLSEESLAEPSVVETKDYGSTVQLEIPYPTPRETIGINPDDTLAEAGKKVWLYYFAEMLSHEQGTLQGENIEELHDMRVATRRMRTAFDIFGPVYDPKTIKRHLKGLRTIGRVLGQVRDMDVILENGIYYQNKMKENARPGLEPLLNDWMETINRQRTKMIKHLQSLAYLNFKQNFNIFLQVSDNIKTQLIENDGMNSRVRDTVPVLVYSRYAVVRSYESILPTASVPQLHALRIEFKKLRYTLEYFREILGEGANQAINELKQLQDHLGELHDADVACQLVRGFLKAWDEEQILKPIPERLNPEPIVSYLAYLHAERYRLISKFPELWRKFNRPDFRQNIALAISLL
jgi:CHAD domain-containing protein